MKLRSAIKAFVVSMMVVLTIFNSLVFVVNADETLEGFQYLDATGYGSYQWFYYENGQRCKGWKKVDGYWYFFNDGNIYGPSGAMVYDMWCQVDDVWYHFDEDGKMDGNGKNFFGWKYLNECWFFFESAGQEGKGWFQHNGKTYYLDTYAKKSGYGFFEGAMCVGARYVGDTQYYFEADGSLATQSGWRRSEASDSLYQIGWYYINADGTVANGYCYIDGYWYFTPGDGLFLANILAVSGTEDNRRYAYYDRNGRAVTGWYLRYDTWYYGKSDGFLADGWQLIDGKWYYFVEAKMQTGLQIIDGKYYMFRDSGSMVTGWVRLDNRWLYFGRNGAMQTGWVNDNGTWYYIDPVINDITIGMVVIDGKIYMFRDNGAMHIGWINIGGNWYYFGNDGSIRNGWQKINGKWYYIDTETCIMVHDTYVGGYYLGSDGAMV